jgi:HSP20 family molecular chaperone IbpA
MMTRLEQSIEVNAPAHIVYNQLTQFEDYPRFMEDIEEVKQLDDTHLHWRAKMNSHAMEWDAEITEQVPDQYIVWRNNAGPIQVQRVAVRPLEDNKARVTMSMEYEAQQQQAEQFDIEEKIVQHAVHDLMRFKRFIESRQQETGAWRDEVHQGMRTGENNASTQQGGGQRVNSWTQGLQGPNPDEGMPSLGQQEQSTQTPASLSPEQGKDAANVSEEQSFDQQSQQARKIGQAPAEAVDAMQAAVGGAPGGQDRGGRQAQQQAGSHQADGHDPSLKQPRQQPSNAAQDSTIATANAMNPKAWLPNLLHAWEEPFVMMRKMTEDMDQLFERFLGRPMYGSRSKAAASSSTLSWTPPLEVTQRENQLVIRAEVPGIKQDDVHVEVKGDRLIIEGDRHEESQDTGQGYRRTERSYGHFYRVIALPDGADPDGAAATMRDGVLEITMPMQQQARRQGRQLDIR